MSLPFHDISFSFDCESVHNSETHGHMNLYTLLKTSKFDTNQSNSLQGWCSPIQQQELLHLLRSKLGFTRNCYLSLVFSCDENRPFDYSYFHNVQAKYNQPNLILFETNSGSIFGGFTSKAWVRQRSDVENVRDEHAFLFSINLNQIDDSPSPPIQNITNESCEKSNLHIYGLAHFQQKVAITILDDDKYGGIMFGRDTLFISNDCTNPNKDSCSLYIDSREATYCRGDDVIELENFYIKKLSFYHIK